MPDTLGIDIGGTSVKTAMLRDREVIGTSRSERYQRPDRAALLAAIQSAVQSLPARRQSGGWDQVGLCLPGLFDHNTRAVTLSVNLPVLAGESVDRLITEALGTIAHPVTITTDARATAHAFYTRHQWTGRLFSLALGTGVGAAVLDNGAVSLAVDGDSPGHFGQLDVSLAGHEVIGPDGGRGSLEGYLRDAALHDRSGADYYDRTVLLLTAIARAVRIAHALYRPRHVLIAGGVAADLKPHYALLNDSIRSQLTSIARPAWDLHIADDPSLAAIGAALLATASEAK